MKVVKSILAIAVVGLIAFFVIKSLAFTPPVPTPLPEPKNQFIEQIEKETDSIVSLPNSKFCKPTYNRVQSLIDNYYKPHPPKYTYGRLGKTQLENNQLKENLSKNLYSVYAEKFIQQSFYVFNGPTWDILKIGVIRNETIRLRSSTFLVANSPVAIKLLEIQQILSKYDEINNFIKTSRNIKFTNYSLGSKFPFSTLKYKISRIDNYEKNNLNNSYVNNCTLLHLGLNNTKSILINKYLKYLENIIPIWTGRYNNLSTFKEYRNIVYDPIKKELDDFRNNCDNNNYPYDRNRYNALLRELNSDSTEAYKYFTEIINLTKNHEN